MLTVRGFSLISDIEPVAPGHCLIISHRHTVSMASLPEPERVRLWALVARATARMKQLGRVVLVFERGNYLSNKSGSASVDHAHLHLIPLGHWPAADGLSGAIRPRSAWCRRTTRAGYFSVQVFPYGPILLGAADTLPSQFIRRWVGALVDNPDWDWKQERSDLKRRHLQRRNAVRLRSILRR